jgi:hypothetical protein
MIGIDDGLRRAAERRGGRKDRTYSTVGKALKAWLDNNSWVPHTLELLRSPAWQQRSAYAARLIDLLERDYLAHSGRTNGHLRATWEQMRLAKIPNRRVADTIAEVQELGLVVVTHQGSYRGGARLNPTTFRLCYLPSLFKPIAGPPCYHLPTDEWRAVTEKIRSNAPTRGASSHAQGEHSADRGAPEKIVKFPQRVAFGGRRRQ